MTNRFRSASLLALATIPLIALPVTAQQVGPGPVDLTDAHSWLRKWCATDHWRDYGQQHMKQCEQLAAMFAVPRRNPTAPPAEALVLAQPPAKTPAQIRMEQLQAQQRSAAAAEQAQWRVFPSSQAQATPYNPLAPDSWLSSKLQAYDPSTCPYLYRWSGWRVDPATGWRVTDYRCGAQPTVNQVAVDCDTFKVTTRVLQTWITPYIPTRPRESEMVVALCSNLAERKTQ